MDIVLNRNLSYHISVRGIQLERYYALTAALGYGLDKNEHSECLCALFVIAHNYDINSFHG